MSLLLRENAKREGMRRRTSVLWGNHQHGLISALEWLLFGAAIAFILRHSDQGLGLMRTLISLAER